MLEAARRDGESYACEICYALRRHLLHRRLYVTFAIDGCPRLRDMLHMRRVCAPDAVCHAARVATSLRSAQNTPVIHTYHALMPLIWRRLRFSCARALFRRHTFRRASRRYAAAIFTRCPRYGACRVTLFALRRAFMLFYARCRRAVRYALMIIRLTIDRLIDRCWQRAARRAQAVCSIVARVIDYSGTCAVRVTRVVYAATIAHA